MQKIFTSTIVRIACVLTIFMFGITGNVNAQLAAGALNFDGTDDYVNVPNVSIMNQSPLTIEAWVKPEVRTDGTNINQYGNNVISNDLTGSYGTGFGVVVLSNNSSGIIVAYKNGLRFINTSLTAGTWYHVSVVYTPGLVKTYLNGNLIDTHNFSQNTGTSSTLIRIGKYSDDNTLGTTRFFKGDIDEVRIWNRALCQGEIINNMGCEVTLPQTGLYSYYKFNVGLIGILNSLFSTLPDVSGNNNDGTLNNFSLLGALSNWVAGKANGSCGGFTPPLATITAAGSTTLCQGDAVLLTANSGNSYQWYNFGVAIGGETNQTYSASQTGDYTVAVTTGNCTITSAIKTVTVNPVPSLFINSTTTSICAGTPVSLSLGGSNNAANAANFNAVNTNDYVSIPHQAQLNPATITLEAWVRPSQSGVDKGIIMKLPASGSGQIGYGFRQTAANRFQFVIGSIGNEVFAQSAVQSIGPWYHLTGTYDGSVIRLYVNGALAGSAAATGAITSTAPIIVGNSNSLNQPFKGAIDELRISNNVKTATQIGCDYKVSTDPTSSNLVGYWRMNEVNGTTTPDVTTYHNNGLLVNTASLISSSASVGNTYRWDAATGITNVNNACITLTPTATTVYKATATNSYGCSVKDSVTVTVFPSGQTFNVTGGGNYCIGAPGLPIGLSGSQVGISYQLKKGASNIGGLVQGTGNAMTVGLAIESGTYTVIAVNNNCTNTMAGTASVVANSSPAITLTSITNPLCNGANTGAIDLNVSGGTNPRTYAWSNNATTEDLSNIGAGTYKLNVSDVNGCKDSATYTLTEPTAPVMSAVVSNVSCNGVGDGSITLTTGGTAPYTYTWSNMANSKNVSNLTPGNYSVSVMDALGCVSDKTYTVTQPAALAPIATPINISCGGNQDGAVTLVVNGGTAPYTYDWSNNATTQNINGLSAGSYSVVVTDAHGCEAGVSTTVTQGAPLQVTGLATDVTCFGAGNGSIQLTPVTGIAPFTYSWSNNSTAQNISNLTPGTYSVTVHDSRNCITTGSYTISQSSAALTTSVSHTNPLCNGASTGTVDLTVSGGTAPYTYLWSNNEVSQDISGVAADVYSVAVTDAKNCIVNDAATVTQPAAIQLSATTTKTYCGDSTASIHLTVTGGTAPYSFHWNTGSTNQNMNGLHTGDYSVIVTDANGCSANELYTISDSSSMSMTAAVTNAMCNSQSSGAIALTITGGIAPFTYAWSDNVNTEDRSQITAGTYSVVVTDNGGCKVGGTYTVEQPSAMTVSAEVFGTSCHIQSNGGATADGAIYLTLNGGAAPYSFVWSDTAYYANTQDIEWIPAATYHVNITDDNGCVTNDSFVVGQPALMHIAANVTNIGCNVTSGAVATVVTGGTPPYSYEWSTTATTSDISGLTPGFYNLIVTDDYGCNVNDFYDITADSFALSSTVTDVACNGTSTGAVDVTVESGSAPYTYTWSNNATSQDLNNIVAGTYTLFATDANGCSDTLTATVAQPAALTPATTVTNNMCNGQNGGAIDLTVSGGVAPYTYIWNNNATTEDIAGLSAGAYNVVITDANGCIQAASATITSPMAITASAIATNATCSANNGTITLTVNGGVAPYTYNWGAGITTQNRTGLAGGTYNVTITDANGCTKTATATVGQTTTPAITATVNNPSCGNNNGSVNITVTGGTTPYSYLWNNNATSQNLSSIGTGTYSVVVTDANHCTATGSYTLTSVDTSAPVITGPTSGSTVTQNPVAPALDFNVFVMNNATLAGGQTEGGFALGGNLTLAGDHTVSTNSAGTFTVGSVPVTLVVGGKVIYQSGNSLYVNQNGYVKIGDSTLSKVWYKDQNNAYSPIRITNGNNYNGSPRINLQANSQNLNVSAINNPVFQSNVIDFASAFVQLKSNATSLSTLSDNASLTNANGNPIAHTNLPSQVKINLATGTNVLNINASDLNAVQNFTYNQQPASNRVLIINVNAPGTFNWNVWNSGGIGSSNSPYIIYNFYNTNTLTVQGNGSVYGTLFAPYADINKTNSQNIAGQIIGQSLNQTGGANLYNKFAATVTSGTTTVIVKNSTNNRNTGTTACAYTVSGTEFNTTATDNCATPTLTYALTGATTGTGTNLAGVSLNKGTTTITWTATDGTNVSTYNFNVAVADNVNPTVVTKNITVSLDANGNATIVPADINNGSTDNCGIVTYALSKTSFNTSNLGANTVTLTATDASGNTGSGNATVTIVDNAAPVITCPASITVACNATPAKTGTAIATDNAGTPVITYTDAVTGNTTIRTWKATDASNNFSTCTQTITVSPMAAAAVATNINCNGAANGAINLTVNGGVVPYTYNWGAGITTQNRTALAAGTYNVTATDANGCTATTSATITEPTAIAIATTATSATCNANNGTITLNVTGGTAPYTYNWGAGVTTQNRTGLAGGTYNVTITDANGCTKTTSATINQSTANITTTTTVTNATCNGANGAITLAVSGGTAPYTYNWGAGVTTQNRTGLAGGTYTVTITDANGCTKTVTATVNQSTSTLAVTGTTTNISCNGNNNGAVNITVTGGATPYTYAWTGGATTKNISGKTASVYTVVVTDNNGCSVTSSFTITQPAALALSAVQTNVSCNGSDNGSIDLSVSGGTAPYSYNWNLGNSNNNNNNCWNWWNWWCNNNCWNNNNNTTSSSQDVNGLEEGNYSVTVTDANGCSATASYTITEPTAISISVSKMNVSCKNGNNGTITLNVSGGTSPYTYNWGNNITTQSRSGLAAGTYNVTVTDAHGCTNSASVSISQPSSSLTTSGSVTNITCKGNNNGAVNLSVSGGTSPYTYSWTGGATTQDISGRTAGVYTVVITDANGCSLSQSFTITEPAAALSISAALTHVSCNGGDNGAVNLTVTGGAAPYTYNWKLGGSNNNNTNCWNWWNWWCNNNCNNNNNNNAHTQDVSGLEEGTYSVSVTDANGCMVSGVYTINEPTAISLTANKTNVSCKNGTNGTITLAVSGGTSPYTYNWGSNITTQNRSGLAAGTYSVTVTDAKGCTKNTSVTITQPTNGITITGTVTNVTCNGSNNGAVNVSVSGGSSPYSYSWTGGATTQDISGKAAGNYTVTVQDANGCSDNDMFTITQPNAISASIAVSPVVTVTNGQSYTIYDGYGPQSVTLSASASGGNGGFTYHWSPSTGVSNVNAATTSVSPATTTTYTVTITDNKGCSKTVSKTINVVDVTCGNKEDKVIVCHNGNEICVSSNAVQAHLNHGCYVGHCNGNAKGETADNEVKGIQELVGKNIRVYPNPSTGIFLLELPEGVMNASVLITDMSGRMIERRIAMGENSIRFDLSKVAQGIYMIQVSVGADKYQSKITIE